MEPFKRQIFATKFRLPVAVAVAVLMLLVAFSSGCGSETGPTSTEFGSGPGDGVAEGTSAVPPVDTLLCADCELVEVIEVLDANTVRTAIGDIQMYAAYVIDQPADCAALAIERLTSLAGGAIRIETGPPDTVRNDSDHYYLFTADGRSIEEQLVREGLALVWTQDGQHVGWFVFRGASARENEAGCLWKGYNAFLRGEPGDFRIPGLTYPEAR
ncbi:MAG: hypothetical protein J4N63_02710 [Chloroflexi bacterium]|nr:hypothetical protein [Chloroflexota bacterium]MCI0774251.1 hypothetical protein [Chloroflexota bacterium]MCI0808044.1 hypothetical protein [Chloroflexota bacterium]MCI0833310.1 hypothetical protein [Chloroflexota bacterium]MCI0836313.1 hypothetical protein [Chloroflexota bacterium]